MGPPKPARGALRLPGRGLGLALLGIWLCGQAWPGDFHFLLGATRPGGRPGREPSRAARHVQTRTIGGPEVSDKKAEALKVLGLPVTSTYKAARAAYRKLARKKHPDVVGDHEAAQEEFRHIVEAYAAIVSDGEEDWVVRDKIRAAWQEMADERTKLGRKWRAKIRARVKLMEKMVMETANLQVLVAVVGVSYLLAA
mmetsp:Transcript_21320/g.63637  ORF Transcript_21320/g.63637 Transcript_21320/m.63637 type:complete len:197 (+) Transcript_21320:20-610(+)